MKAKRKLKEITYQVKCPYQENHVFDKTFIIEAGSEETHETLVDLFCEECHQLFSLKVKAKVVEDGPVYRSVNE